MERDMVVSFATMSNWGFWGKVMPTRRSGDWYNELSIVRNSTNDATPSTTIA